MKHKKILSLLLSILIISSIFSFSVVASATENGVVSVGNATGKAGEEVVVPIAVTKNPGIVGVAFSINYDEKLTIIEVNNVSSWEGYTPSGDLSMKPFNISYTSARFDNDTSTGKLVEVTFKIPNDAQPTDIYEIYLTYDEENIFDVDMNNVSFDTLAGQISVESETTTEPQGNKGEVVVGSVTGMAGQEVVVPITATKNPGIVGAAFSIHYDEKLTLTKIENVAPWEGYTPSGNLSMNPFNFSYSSANFDNDTSTGKLVEVTFKIPNDAQPTDTYEIYLTFNEENIFDVDMNNVSFDTIAGIIEIQSTLGYTLGDVTEDTVVNLGDVLAIQQYLASIKVLNDNQISASDVTGDGKTSVQDVITMQQYLANIISKLPAQ